MPAIEKSKNRLRIAKVAILLLYAGLVIWLTLHHEPWRDEADIWLMGRDNSFSQLFERVGYSGSPMLWHLLVAVLAKANLPYLSMNLLNAFMGIGAAAIILFFSPFGLIANSLLIFSYLFSYEYPVVARSYQLSVLLIVFLAAFHKRRDTFPKTYSFALALLANSNLHGLIISLTLLVANIGSLLLKKGNFRLLVQATVPALLGISLAIYQMIPPSDGQFKADFINFQPTDLALSIREPFAPNLSNLDHAQKPALQDLTSAARLSLSIAAIIALLILTRRSRWAQFTMLGSWSGLCLLFLFKYSGGIRHWGFLLVIAVYACWVALQEKNAATTITESTSEKEPSNRGLLIKFPRYAEGFAKYAISTALLYSVATAFQAWNTETAVRFSGAKEAGEFISRNNLDENPIASYWAHTCKPILPYLACKLFYYPDQNRYGSFMLWDKNTYRQFGERRLMRRLNKRFGSDGKLVLIMAPVPLKHAHEHRFRLVYETKGEVITTDERYYVYVRDGVTATHSPANKLVVNQESGGTTK